MRRALEVPAVLLLAAVSLRADEKKEPGLYVTGDLAFLWTSGNSKASSLGLKLDLARLWANHLGFRCARSLAATSD